MSPQVNSVTFYKCSIKSNVCKSQSKAFLVRTWSKINLSLFWLSIYIYYKTIKRQTFVHPFNKIFVFHPQIYNPRKLRFSTIQSQPEQTGKYTLDKYLGYAAAYHPQMLGSGGQPLPQDPSTFPAESQMPLATNAESWANLAMGTSTPRNLSRMTDGSTNADGSLPSLSASQTGVCQFNYKKQKQH